jgi:hypothetical protein
VLSLLELGRVRAEARSKLRLRLGLGELGSLRRLGGGQRMVSRK